MKGLIKYIAPVFIITIMINFVFACAQVKDGNKNVLQIWIDSANGSNGSVALVSVRVKNFKAIVSMQGTISFDTSVVTFSNTTEFNLPGLDNTSFGTKYSSAGMLTYSWFTQSLYGQSLNDSTVIFSLVFNLKGNPSMTSFIDFSNSPTITEFADTSLRVLNPVLNNGKIKITGAYLNNGLIFKIDSVKSTTNQVSVPVRVKKFNGIMAFQGTILFDTSVVYLTSIGQFSLNGLDNTCFGINHAIDGIITFSWYDATLTGQNVPDDSALFIMSFNVQSNPGSQTNLNFVNSPTQLEFVDKNYNIESANLIPGLIDVITISSYSITGSLTYDNIASTPLSNAYVYLLNSEGQKIDSNLSTVNGVYKIANISAGSYFVTASISTKPVNTCNPVDALLVNRNYIKAYTFKDNLEKQAADVNGDNKINPVDALLINRKYIKAISKFSAGDWIIEKDPVSIFNQNIIQNIKCICVGDVQGAFTP